MIKLIVITGGVQKGPKDASVFAFPTLKVACTSGRKCLYSLVNYI